MAVVEAYLQGGECDGTHVTFDFPGAPPDSTNCKDSLYAITRPAQYHNGARIFKYAGPITTPGTGTAGVPAKGIRGYNHFARSLAHTLPTKLRRAELIRAQALRRLHVPRRLGG